MTVKSYQELEVWQKAMTFVESVYRATQAFPREEQFGITSQIRRAAVSIPSNIAEGQGGHTTQAFPHHLSIACGSLQETETQIMLAHRLGYMEKHAHDELLGAAGEIGRMLNGLQRSLTARNEPSLFMNSSKDSAVRPYIPRVVFELTEHLPIESAGSVVAPR